MKLLAFALVTIVLMAAFVVGCNPPPQDSKQAEQKPTGAAVVGGKQVVGGGPGAQAASPQN